MKLLQIIIILIITFNFHSCVNKKAEMEFCFSTVVRGSVFVNCTIDDMVIPCGFLSCTDCSEGNSYFNFNERDACGASLSGYYIELPDSACFRWSAEYKNGSKKDSLERFEKKIKLPVFPKLKRNQYYRVGFIVAYQDCVHCNIEVVDKKPRRSDKQFLEDIQRFEDSIKPYRDSVWRVQDSLKALKKSRLKGN